MDLVYEIQQALNDDEIKRIIDEVIEEESEYSKDVNNNETIIGADISMNPQQSFTLKKEEEEYNQKCNGYYIGFIPKGTKLVYGIRVDNELCSQYSGGSYYYIDDFSYIYEFAKFIKDKKIANVFNIIAYAYIFLRKYYDNSLIPMDRNEMHNLIYRNERDFFEPIIEHSNRDFKGNGSAECTEFSSAMNNLLSIFGIDVMYIQDTYHAYNLVALPNEFEIGKFDYYIIDTTIRVACYDIDSTCYSEEAYIQLIDDFDEEKLAEFLRGNNPIQVKKFYLVNDGLNYIRMYFNETDKYDIQRDYSLKIEGKYLTLKFKK